MVTETVVGERGYTLSGGQTPAHRDCQNVAPSSSDPHPRRRHQPIDVHVESGIYEALRGLLAQRTTIVIAHRISTIALAQSGLGAR